MRDCGRRMLPPPLTAKIVEEALAALPEGAQFGFQTVLRCFEVCF